MNKALLIGALCVYCFVALAISNVFPSVILTYMLGAGYGAIAIKTVEKLAEGESRR